MCATCPTYTIIVYLITLMIVKSTNYDAPHDVVKSFLFFLPLFYIQIFSPLVQNHPKFHLCVH
jgi:hypothetical protein